MMNDIAEALTPFVESKQKEVSSFLTNARLNMYLKRWRNTDLPLNKPEFLTEPMYESTANQIRDAVKEILE